MAEYIERKAANDWLVDMFYSEEDEGCKELVERFNKAIPAADVAPLRWMPVAESLPEDGQNVIICTKSGKVGEATYQARVNVLDLDFPAIWFLLNEHGEQYRTEDVVGWMQLPQPPKEEK